MSPAASAIKQLIELVARQLVNNPDTVKVPAVLSDTASVLELRMAREDRGCVIGKQGRTANSIRTIPNVVASRTNRRSSSRSSKRSSRALTDALIEFV